MSNNFSSFTGRFRVHKDSSQPPSHDPGRVEKRPRESLVCNQCRRSKLRCDRGQPCSSCVRRGEAEGCSYQQPSTSRTGTNRHAEERLLHLEATVRQLMQSQPPYQASSQSGQPVAQEHAPTGLLPTDHLRIEQQVDCTRYVGSTHWSSILDDLSELKTILSSSSDVQELEEPTGFEFFSSGSELIFGTSGDFDVRHIVSEYLPPKVEADRLLSLYFRNETFIVPFIHTGCFSRQYKKFWADTANANPLWLSILFSICHIAHLIGRATGSRQSSQDDLAAGRLHVAAGQCLVLGEYHRPQQFTVEALALYGQCKNTMSLDPSREAGAILGIVVRIAYEMGYHRDADSFGSFSIFEGEMRRRFWAAIKQMDLMISFQLGLPSNINLEQCDTKSPRHLLDSDFDEDTLALPASRSEEEPTRLLWFIVKDRQISSFGKVCQVVLSSKEKSETDILQLDEEIRRTHDTIPTILQTRPLSESLADSPFLIMTRLYVEFIYLKSLCALHRMYMARGNVFSTRRCVEAGKSLVRQFIHTYNEFLPGGQLCTERWMLTNFTMNDFLLGIMILCLVVHTHWKRGTRDSAIGDATENEALALLEQSLAICLEKSTVSRDALRVSHAIHLTLNIARNSNTARSTNSPFSTTLIASSLGIQGEAHGADSPSLLLHARHDHTQGHEAAIFGALDPFNFLGNDIENIDWSVFDVPDTYLMDGSAPI